MALPIALAGTLATACAQGIGRFAFTPMLPAMQADDGLSTAAAGYLASANFIGYLVGALLAAWAPMQARRSAWIAAALTASVVTTAAMGWTHDAAVWTILRVVSGVCSAFVLIFVSGAVLEYLVAAERSAWSQLTFTGVGVGIALSAVAVDVTGRLGASAAWQWQWLAALGALLAIVAWRGLQRLPAARAQLQRASRSAVSGAADPSLADASAACSTISPAALDAGTVTRLRWLTWSYGCMGFGYVITATFIVLMVRTLQVGRDGETVVWLIVGLSAVPSNALWFKLALRIGFYRALIAAHGVQALGVALAALAGNLAGLLVGAAMLGSTLMAISVLIIHVLRQLLPPERVQRSIATMTAAFGLGQIIGPALAGALAHAGASLTLPSLMASGVLLAGAVMIRVAERTPRAVAEPTSTRVN